MIKNVHFIGIGGSGLSAIARLLLESGYSISGSDRTLSPLTRDLEIAGMRIFAGHDSRNINGAGMVIRSSAIPDDNPEVQAALAAGIPVMKRMDFLGQLMVGKTVAAIAGSHGKTSTTAMLAWMLSRLGQDPSYIIGGISKDLGTNAHAGTGNVFVIEADEYDHMFLGLQPDLAVVTNIEHDHPDCYPTPEIYTRAFVDFVHKMKPCGSLFVCQDNPPALSMAYEVAEGCKTFTYGFGSNANYIADKPFSNSIGGFTYSAAFQQKGQIEDLADIQLQVPGRHNVLNSIAALGMIHQLGLPVKEAALALAEFTGAGRRFDILGEVGGITIIDDYAHHPTEIKTTIEAARSRYPSRRIWVVWQPHTYSRIKSLFNQFSTAFDSADEVIVTEIFAAREKPQGFSAIDIANKITNPHTRFIASFDETVNYLLKQLNPSDVVLVLSAGDATQVSLQVFNSLTEKGAAKAS